MEAAVPMTNIINVLAWLMTAAVNVVAVIQRSNVICIRERLLEHHRYNFGVVGIAGLAISRCASGQRDRGISNLAKMDIKLVSGNKNRLVYT